MNHRERLLRVLNYQPVDRGIYGVWVWAWPETRQRWLGEGYDPDREPYFQVDPWDWQGGWFMPAPPFARTVVEEDEQTVVYLNHEGILLLNSLWCPVDTPAPGAKPLNTPQAV